MEKKYCPKCDTTKLASEFHKRGKFLMGYCKPCQRSYVGARRKTMIKDFRQIIADAKDKPCMDCGERHPKWAMDFDHRDPSKKKYQIAKLASFGSNLTKLLDEIRKCDVVCALCHRYRTHGQIRARSTTVSTHV